jgi:hypothetical protein
MLIGFHRTGKNKEGPQSQDGKVEWQKRLIRMDADEAFLFLDKAVARQPGNRLQSRCRKR